MRKHNSGYVIASDNVAYCSLGGRWLNQHVFSEFTVSLGNGIRTHLVLSC